MPKSMTADEMRELLSALDAKMTEDRIQDAVRFRGPKGEIFLVFDTGKVVVQGKKTDLSSAVSSFIDGDAESSKPSSAAASNEDPNAAPVFIVYGHDEAARDGLELVLRRMGLKPVVLAKLAAAGDTIIEKLEHYIGEHGTAEYACVLLTPDDQGHKAGKTDEMKYRARQNVVLELGMVLARLGRKRVAILHKKSVELPSDINGLLYIAFEERVDEVASSLFKELQNAGYKPKVEGL